jgi:hypothetical protein
MPFLHGRIDYFGFVLLKDQHSLPQVNRVGPV